MTDPGDVRHLQQRPVPDPQDRFGGLGLPHAAAGQFMGMDITEPEVDFVGLAQSLGVSAVRVTEPDELAERVAKSLTGDRPQLFDVPISRELPGH